MPSSVRHAATLSNALTGTVIAIACATVCVRGAADSPRSKLTGNGIRKEKWSIIARERCDLSQKMSLAVVQQLFWMPYVTSHFKLSRRHRTTTSFQPDVGKENGVTANIGSVCRVVCP
jgi:hypothetical protein